MNAFEFEQPTPAARGGRPQPGALPERELKYVVVCEQCRGGWLWKFREEWPASEAAAAHREWSRHDVTVKETP